MRLQHRPRALSPLYLTNTRFLLLLLGSSSAACRARRGKAEGFDMEYHKDNPLRNLLPLLQQLCDAVVHPSSSQNAAYYYHRYYERTPSAPSLLPSIQPRSHCHWHNYVVSLAWLDHMIEFLFSFSFPVICCCSDCPSLLISIAPAGDGTRLQFLWSTHCSLRCVACSCRH